ENLLAELPGIDKLYGYSEDGYAAVTVSFAVGTPLEAAKTRLYDKIGSNVSNRPYGVGDISIQSINPEELPQAVFALTYSGASLSEVEQGMYLRSIAYQLREELKLVPNTSTIEILGGYVNSVNIELSPTKLDSLGLSTDVVKQAIQARLGKQSLSVIDSSGSLTSIAIVDTQDTVEALGELIITQAKDGVSIRIRDIATINRGPSRPSSYYSFQKVNSVADSAVFLGISKKQGSNAVGVVEALLERLDEIRPTLPSNISIEIIQNEGETAREATDELLFHLILSIVIVFAVLVVFLGLKNATNAAFCIPMVLGIVFIVAFIFSIDINRITLFALILSLGILVDDSIVVVENNARHLSLRHQNGKTRKQALLDSVREVGVSIILSTVTRILSFLGMFAVTGMMGDYMRPIPVFASIALTASLFVAFSINPFLANFLSKRSEKSGKTESEHSEDTEDSAILNRYTKLLSQFIGQDAAKKRRRKWLKPAFWIALILVISIPIVLDVFRARMLPKADKDQVYLWIDLPRSTSVDTTQEATKLAGDFFTASGSLPEALQIVESVSSVSGNRFLPDFSNLFRGTLDRTRPNQASLRINLIGAKERSLSSEKFVIAVRPLLRAKLLEQFPDATLRLLEDPPGPPTIATLHIKAKGPADASIDSLTKFSEMLEGVVRNIAEKQHIEDLSNTVSRPMSQIVVHLDQQRLNERNVDRSRVESAIATTFTDATLGLVGTDETVLEPIPIVLSFAKAHRSQDSLKNLIVMNRLGSPVRLDEIASFETDWVRREIYTENRSTTINLYAEMGANSVVYPVLALYGAFEKPEIEAAGFRKIGSNPYGIQFESLADGREYNLEWGGEWELTMDTFRDMGTAMILSLLAIYFLVVAEFRSFRIGGIIMMTFLFSFFGIFPGFGLLYLTSEVYFTATAMIGAIALGGIVVGNAIILLDYVEQLRREGHDLEYSVLEGSKKRFIPVMLTSIAAVLGSMIITSDPVWSGLAWSIIFGLSASAILTLILVPVFFYDLELRRKPHVEIE
ncbi:MAG: efflux RND transporter permease subunit, partial [Candidatus Gracilibacteria bacterium]|nr:efflux RND transporter permease subunit [Candidatus Gracilibacteria bacterium]